MTSSIVSSCQAVVFHYTNIVPSGDNADTSVSTIEIKKECRSFEYTKNIAEPAGSFTLQVTADRNWKRTVFAGDWIVVYLTNEGYTRPKVRNIRILGNIDRVAQFTTRNDKGLLETSYVISGRDWGKVLTANIWFNPLNTTKLLLSVLYKSGSPSELTDHLIDVFLGGKIPIETILTQPQMNQWVIPYDLLSYLGAVDTTPSSLPGGVRFVNIMKRNIQSVSGRKAIENFVSLQGNIWQILQSFSNDVVNELYTEMDSFTDINVPTITLRTKPFTSKSYVGSYSIYDQLNFFTDLDSVTIKGEEIIGSDIGYSDQDLYNLFLLVSKSDFLNVESLLSQLKPDYPHLNPASIQRSGLRMMYGETDYALFTGDGVNSKINPQLLRDWNELLLHFYDKLFLMEAGTIEISKANPGVRVGRTLIIEDWPLVSQSSEVSLSKNQKIFYIEGYTDRWEYPGSWTQTVHLTRGQYLVNGLETLPYEVDDPNKIYTGQSVVNKQERSPYGFDS